MSSTSFTPSPSALILESPFLRASILPSVGGKLYDLVRKASGRNFLWHNPRIVPRPYPIDSNFDNYWCGGWDDGFPTADPCEYKGEVYPNLGELRSLEWTVERATATEAVLSCYGPISPVRVEKVVSLDTTLPVIRVGYRILHVGTVPFEFLFGTHPALAVNERSVLRIPARTGIVGLSGDAVRFGAAEQEYAWPMLETRDGLFDMSRVHAPESRLFFGHYAMALEGGWYAVEHGDTGEGFLMRFPRAQCPYLWMWLVYGGWRGYHHVIVEPWTSYPVHLGEAVKRGTARSLQPGEEFRVEFEVMLYGDGVDLKQARERLAC